MITLNRLITFSRIGTYYNIIVSHKRHVDNEVIINEIKERLCTGETQIRLLDFALVAKRQ